jgi:integrase
VFPFTSMRVEQTQVLTRSELAAVLRAGRRPNQSANARRNHVIVRLACCCGLRVSEIAGLRLGDVVVGIARPYLRLRREVTKGCRPRSVPLWCDGERLAVLTEWLRERCEQGGKGSDPFACSVQAHRRGQRLQQAAVRRRFLTACRVLGSTRVRTLTIHHGRHTFVSHALAGGRSLAEVRAAAGHANVAMTSAYLHIVVDEEENIGQLFLYE